MAQHFLAELNGFPSTLTHSLEDGKFSLKTEKIFAIKYISPVIMFPETYSLDISDNRKVKNLEHLKKLKKLKRLTLTRCHSLTDFKFLKNMKLQYLSLEGTFIRNLEVLRKMPLRELALGALGLELIPLNSCPDLKKLTVARRRYPKNTLIFLNKSVKVYYRGHKTPVLR